MDPDIETQSKVCTKCGVDRPFSDFYKMRRGRHGLNSWCKFCMDKRRREWREENRERSRATDNAWRAQNPERTALHRVKSEYGLTQEEAEALLASPCAICGSSEDLTIDHDHSCCPRVDKRVRACGKCVRGRLCRGCNLGLGNFGDDPQRLIAAAAYLDERRSSCS